MFEKSVSSIVLVVVLVLVLGFFKEFRGRGREGGRGAHRNFQTRSKKNSILTADWSEWAWRDEPATKAARGHSCPQQLRQQCRCRFWSRFQYDACCGQECPRAGKSAQPAKAFMHGITDSEM